MIWKGGVRPKSLDGTPAINCDKTGAPSPKGRYIKWSELNVHGNVIWNIAKISIPKKTKNLDKEAVKDFKFVKPIKIRRTLVRIMSKLGVAFSDAVNSIKLTTNVPIAAWTSNGLREEVLVNPYFLSQKSSIGYFVVKRVLMHRALYRGRPHLKDRQLLSLVIDILASRILAETPNGKKNNKWIEFCQWIFSDESTETIVALQNAGLTESQQKRLKVSEPEIYKVWEELYGLKDKTVLTRKNGRVVEKTVKNCFSTEFLKWDVEGLYFRLRKFITDKDKQNNNDMGMVLCDDSQCIDNLQVIGDLSSERSRQVENVESAVRRSLLDKKYQKLKLGNFGNALTDFWDTCYIKGDDYSRKQMAEYAEQMKTTRTMSTIVGYLNEEVGIDSKESLVPIRLTASGMERILIGMRPPYFPSYLCEDGLADKHRIIVFFDTSPSMQNYFPYIVKMCDDLQDTMDLVFARNDNGDNGTFTFGGSVKDLTHKEFSEMKKGQLPISNSTSFNALIDYINTNIPTSDIDSVVVFTDGESDLSADISDKFNASGKKCYRVYMRPKNKYAVGEWTSPLDTLNGKSFTLYLNQTDRI